MKKAENWVEKIKGMIKKGNRGNKGNREDKGGSGIPKEILDRLPPGVKIKRIDIGPKQIIKLVLYLVLIFWVIQVVWQLVVPETIEKVSLSTAIGVIKEDKAEEVTVMDNEILIKTKDGQKILTASKEAATSMAEILQREGIDIAKVNFQVENRQGWKMVGEIVSLLLSVGLPILVIFWFLGRQTGGGAGGIFGFGKSTAKLFVKGKQNITFKDVAGVEEAKKDLEEVVDFLKHPEKYKKMGARTPKGVLLVGPSGVGKCITGESLVLTNKGLMEIRDVPKYYQVDDGGKVWGAKVCSLDIEKTRMKKGRASNWYQLGEHKTKKILTEQGYEIEGTFEHPVVVGVEGKLMFKRLDELKKGEAVAISFGQEVFGKRKDVDRQTAYLLGVLTGDGNLSVSSRVGLTNSDAEIIDFFRNYVTERYPEAKVYKKGKYDYIVTYWRFKKDLYKVGMSYLLSFDKEVPKSILQGKRELVVSFIRGLFDTDGCVQKNRSTIEYTSVSERLIRQVQMLLLNMGVVSSLQVKDPAVGRNKKRVYRLTVTGDYLVVYHDKVGFGIKRKQERLRNMAEKIRNKSNTNIDLFYGVGHLVEDQWRNLSKRGLSNEWWSKRIHHIRSRNRISRNSLKLFVDYCRQVDYESEMVDYFRRLLEAKLFFSLVKESKDSKGVVYDFTIPQNHSFVSSGFVSHNTLLAKAVAGEADVPFYSMAGSEFMEMLVGVGASRVRDLFATAKRAGKAIIFIDEIDAIGRMRGGWGDGGHGEREQTLNQILVEMDGFEANTTVIVLAATNRGDLLDPALMRPGRFDRRVMLEMPDIEARKEILKIHARGKPFEDNLDWEVVARRTVGFSGADLENMLNEAAIKAARENKDKIEMADIEEAALKVKLGAEKKRVQTDEDKLITAYHEAGHAIVNYAEGLDPVHRISIVSRGMALGFTLVPPKLDRVHETRSRLVKQMAMAMGGRAAEEMKFKDMTTGAAADISMATRIARDMVVEWGMSNLGPVNLGPQVDLDFNRVYMEPNKISEGMKAKVDEEIKKLTDAALVRAKEVLKENSDKLDKIAKVLVEKESLDEKEFEEMMK